MTTKKTPPAEVTPPAVPPAEVTPPEAEAYPTVGRWSIDHYNTVSFYDSKEDALEHCAFLKKQDIDVEVVDNKANAVS